MPPSAVMSRPTSRSHFGPIGTCGDPAARRDRAHAARGPPTREMLRVALGNLVRDLHERPDAATIRTPRPARADSCAAQPTHERQRSTHQRFIRGGGGHIGRVFIAEGTSQSDACSCTIRSTGVSPVSARNTGETPVLHERCGCLSVFRHDERVNARVAQRTIHAAAVASKNAVELEPAALGDAPAPLVQRVAADLEPPGVQRRQSPAWPSRATTSHA